MHHRPFPTVVTVRSTPPQLTNVLLSPTVYQTGTHIHTLAGCCANFFFFKRQTSYLSNPSSWVYIFFYPVIYYGDHEMQSKTAFSYKKRRKEKTTVKSGIFFSEEEEKLVVGIHPSAYPFLSTARSSCLTFSFWKAKRKKVSKEKNPFQDFSLIVQDLHLTVGLRNAQRDYSLCVCRVFFFSVFSNLKQGKVMHDGRRRGKEDEDDTKYKMQCIPFFPVFRSLDSRE